MARRLASSRSTSARHPWTLTAFGAEFASDFPLPGMRRATGAGSPDVTLSRVAPTWIAERWDPPANRLWSTRLDGHDVAIDQDAAGNHRVSLGALGECLLSPDGRALACAPATPDDRAWQRFLLDTVLFTCRLLPKGVALHASAVARDAQAVAIVAGSGGGKTSLALALIERGWSLLSDDVLFPFVDAGDVYAHPGPPVMNVPRSRATSELGDPLAHFPESDEIWTLVSHTEARVSALRSLCFLDRRPGAGLEVRLLARNPMLITANAIYLAQDTEARRERFELLSDVAAQVPALHLLADPSVPPADLARALEGELPW